MLRPYVIAAGLLFALSACDKRDRDDRPTPAQRQAVSAAEADKARAETEKRRADQALDEAKERQKAAETHLDKAKDWADDVKDKADIDHDEREADRNRDLDDDTWSRFAKGKDRTVDRGDYIIERGTDGTIATYRRTQPVAARVDRSDADLANDVKAKLDADAKVRRFGIDVKADDHVIALRGSVDGPEDAGRAVRLALGVPGVDKVISHLSFRVVK